MKTKHSPLWAVVSLLCLAACGTESTAVVQPPQSADTLLTQLTLEPAFKQARSIFQRPDKVTGLLALSIDSSNQVSGVISFPGEDTSLAEVHGKLDGRRIVLEGGQVPVPPNGAFEWKRFELELSGDETTVWETLTGSAEGTWQLSGGDASEVSEVTVKITGAADVKPATARVEPLMKYVYRHTFWPSDRVHIALSEPVSQAEAVAKIRVLSGNQVVPGALSSTAVLGRVTSLTFQPSLSLPFGAPVRLDVGGLTDLRGNSVNAAAATVVADPGSLLDNPSFENGLTGWSVLGSQGTPTGAFEEVMPANGNQQLVLRQDTGVSGYFDVPTTATALSFSLAFFSENRFASAAYNGTVRLYAAGQPAQVLFDAAEQTNARDACDCGEFSQRVGPQRITVDLSPFRGQRVFLVAEARSSFYYGINYFALVLDDVRVQ